MNATEHLTECYFRLVKNCFTLDDVKVIGGVNRQLDLLAVNLQTGEQFHIETSVTHRKMWAPDADKLNAIFSHKFMGQPKERPGEKTDFALGRNYFDRITATYESVGLSPKKIQRIYVCWMVKDAAALPQTLADILGMHGYPLKVLSLRDVLLPQLRKAVGTTNYDDEVLRTLSLIKEQEDQSPD